MEMTAQDIVTLISNIGFPIVCCGILFYTQNKILTSLQEKLNENGKNIEKLLEDFKEEIRK